MKLNNTVVTLALLGVLAFAALAGGLLPMRGTLVHAANPAKSPRQIDNTCNPAIDASA